MLPLPTVSLPPLPHADAFRPLADHAPVMIWMSGPDGNWTLVNRRWLEFTGLTLAEALRAGWAAGVHPADRDACRSTLTAALEARRPFEMEYRRERADGEYRWVRDTGVPRPGTQGAFAGYIGACVDITDRKQGEEALIERVAQRTRELTAANELLQHQIEERRRIESLLATENRVLELIAKGDEPEQLFEALCEALEGLLPGARCVIRLGGAEAGPAAGQRPNCAPETGIDLFGALARQGACPPLGGALPAPQPSWQPVDGALRELDFRAQWLERIAAPGGRTVGTLGIYSAEPHPPEDETRAASALTARLAGIVAERAHSEEKSREQLAQLAHISRLATMGEMASGLAHELNQPLCAIVNFTEACVELVSRNGAQHELVPGALAEVARQAERAGAVIRRLRDFVKRSEPERKPIDINALVREVVAFTSVEARHNDVRVRVRLAKRAPRAFADSIQIEQVLVNLVRNACEAMRDRGPAPKVLTIETVRRRGAVEVRVSDTGPGVPPELLSRLFEPFFTTKRDGMGMGLSISRSILEVHDGHLWCTAAAQGGTVFHFTLPTAWRAHHG